MEINKRFACLALVILTIAMSVTGCNTLEGAGKDIERTGEKIQEVAD